MYCSQVCENIPQNPPNAQVRQGAGVYYPQLPVNPPNAQGAGAYYPQLPRNPPAQHSGDRVCPNSGCDGWRHYNPRTGRLFTHCGRCQGPK